MAKQQGRVTRFQSGIVEEKLNPPKPEPGSEEYEDDQRRRDEPEIEDEGDDDEEVVTESRTIEPIVHLPGPDKDGNIPPHPDIEGAENEDTVMMMFPKEVRVQHAGIMYTFPAGIHPVPKTIAEMPDKKTGKVRMHPYLRDNKVRRFKVSS